MQWSVINWLYNVASTSASQLRQPNTDGFLHLHCSDFHSSPPQVQRSPSQQSANLTLAFGTQKSPQRAHQLRLQAVNHVVADMT